MTKLKRAMVLCVFGLVMAPMSVSAQDDDDWYYYGDDGLVISTTVYGGTTTSTAATTVGIIFLATGGMRAEMMRDYLKENEAAVQAALRVGSGEAAADLAQMFGVSGENEERFGKMLRAERAALLAEVPQGGPTVAQAERFIALVVEGMRADAALAGDVGRWQEVAAR